MKPVDKFTLDKVLPAWYNMGALKQTNIAE